ncbi:MAG TPA: COX15/CtaA family protein [Planctomycetota bacterium]|jgi:cytochrome c oxidase assembly protein subunit 15
MRNDKTRADILALGFGTSVLMWAVGFFCRIPLGGIGADLSAPPPGDVAAAVPAGVLFALLIACMIAGGIAAGRFADRGWRGGLWAGTLSAVLNLLIVLGVASGKTPNSLSSSAALFVPGSILAGAVLAALGALLGSGFRVQGSGKAVDALAPKSQELRAKSQEPSVSPRLPVPPSPRPSLDWEMILTAIAAAATFLLIFVGGLVTSFSAGLQVPDWPNSFGYLMFFYPISKMSGGIYYEHSHRLLGTLVGLTTLVLVVRTLWSASPRWLKLFSVVALLLVITQGVLGGLRVIGHFTLSTSREQMAPSTTLAIVHGITAQLFFSLLVAWTAFSSRAWQQPTQYSSRRTRSDRILHVALVALLVLQLISGAIVRHTTHLLHLHMTGAGLALVVAVVAGVRTWGLYSQCAILSRIARALMFLIGLQVSLGVVGLFTLGFVMERKSSALVQVISTSSHQSCGVLLLGCAVLLLVWSRRLLVESPQTQQGPEAVRLAE